MRSETEYEANAFAAQLLIDDDELIEYIRDYQPDVVLVMRDDLTCLNTGGNGTLE